MSFEVSEPGGAGPGGDRRSKLTIRSDRQGGYRLCRRSNSRLGLWTLPRRQWGATGVSEQGRAAPAVTPLFFPDRAEPLQCFSESTRWRYFSKFKPPSLPRTPLSAEENKHRVFAKPPLVYSQLPQRKMQGP